IEAVEIAARDCFAGMRYWVADRSVATQTYARGRRRRWRGGGCHLGVGDFAVPRADTAGDHGRCIAGSRQCVVVDVGGDCVGVVLVLPDLGYLFYVFKSEPVEERLAGR